MPKIPPKTKAKRAVSCVRPTTTEVKLTAITTLPKIINPASNKLPVLRPLAKIEQKRLENDPVAVPPKVERVKESKPYDLEANLKLDIKAQQKVVRLSSKEEQILPILINLKTEELTEEQEQDRAPIDLICVIDHSGSMAGEKISLVRETLRSLLEFTNQYDRISLIQFDDRPQQLTPLLRNTKENLEFFNAQINIIKDAGGTNINAGMSLAFDVLKGRKEANPVSSIFLLTDGLDGGAATKVAQSMARLNLSEETFSISTFGFGKDHDEKLLLDISKMKDGSFYYVEKLDTVDEAFADALGGLMSVVALNTNIYVRHCTWKPFEGVMIKNTFGNYWSKKGMTSGYQIRIPQMTAGSEKGFLAEMVIPATDVKVSDKEREITVLEVDLVSENKEGKGKIERTVKLVLHLLNEDEPLDEIDQDGEVMENYFRVKAAISIEEAMKMADMGQFEEGQKKLAGVMNSIAGNKNVDQVRMKPFVQQLITTSNACKQAVYNNSEKKKMTCNSYTIMNQQASSNNPTFSNTVQQKMVIESIRKKM